MALDIVALHTACHQQLSDKIVRLEARIARIDVTASPLPLLTGERTTDIGNKGHRASL
jgi:hypothetical protein